VCEGVYRPKKQRCEWVQRLYFGLYLDANDSHTLAVKPLFDLDRIQVQELVTYGARSNFGWRLLTSSGISLAVLVHHTCE
jgi:hypothetical protein